MEKIFITGCAKSGTTLLNRMFQAYNKAYVIGDEIQLYDFARMLPEQVGDYDFVIGKRSWESIFSCSRLSAKQIQDQKNLIEENHIRIINIVRDGRDVVESYMKDWGINGCFEWMECVKYAQDKIIECKIRFEDLINEPDATQVFITSTFDLEPIAKFSDYPKFVRENYNLEDPKIKDNYKPRPLDPSRIGKEPELYKTMIPNDINYFNKLLEDNGYT